jgi:membrane associated rhomboid family serine protease
MNTDDDGFGNFTLFILAAIFLSILAYEAFNAPNGGNLPGDTRLQFGANKNNLFGALTSSFIHYSPQHLIDNLSLAILLLFFAMFLERKMPKLKSCNPFLWIMLPVSVAVLANIPIHAFFHISPYSIGMSVMIYYLAAFFLCTGKDSIAAAISSAANGYRDVITGKAQPALSSRFALQLLLFFFLAVLLLFAIAGLFDGDKYLPPEGGSFPI